MSESKKTWTLAQVNGAIERLLTERVGERCFWVRAEISNFKKSGSGHAYLDLVEHKDGRVIARSRGMIWRRSLEEIERELGSDTKHVLKNGSEILCELTIAFDKVYGLSMRIASIDLSFTIGSLQKQRDATIKRLIKEGLMERQLELQLPRIIQKVAVIGSPGSSGMADFLKQTEGNEWGYAFDFDLYDSAVQGQHAVGELISALERTRRADYHAVVIIRGGGSKLDLATFDSYELAAAIANHPVPIITGIGHETDEAVADMVANTPTKTPSAVGAYLVEEMLTFEASVTHSFERIREQVQVKLEQQKKFLGVSASVFKNRSISYTRLRRGDLHKSASKIARTSLGRIEAERKTLGKAQLLLQTRPGLVVDQHKSRLEISGTRIKAPASETLQQGRHQLELVARKIRNAASETLAAHTQEHRARQQRLETAPAAYIAQQWQGLDAVKHLLHHLHPDAHLIKGFSIIRHNGKVVDAHAVLKKGDLLEVEVYQRKFIVQFLENDAEWNQLKRSVTKMLQKS